MIKKVSARFAIVLTARISTLTLQVLFIGLVARKSAVQDFGIFIVVMTVSQVVLALTEFGLSNKVLIAGDESWRAGLRSYGHLRLTIWFSSLLAYAISQASSLSVWTFVFSAVALTVSEALGDLACAVRQGRFENISAAVLLLARKSFSLLVMYLFASAGLVALGAILCSAGGVFIFLYDLWPRRYRHGALSHLKHAQHEITLSSIAANLAQLDAFIVFLVLGPSAAGMYAPSTRLISPVNVIMSSAMQVLVPELARSNSNFTRRILSFKRAKLASNILCILLILATPLILKVVPVIFGEQYVGTELVTVAVVVSAALVVSAQVELNWLFATGAPKSLAPSMFLSVASGYLLIWLGGKFFGVAGAALGVTLMHLIGTTVITIKSRKSRA